MPASPWTGSTRKAQVLGGVAPRSASISPKGNTRKPDGNGAAMKIIGGYDDLGLISGNPLDDGSPLARGLERGFDRLGAGIHRKRHFVAGQLVKVAIKQGQLIVADRKS